MKKVLTSFILVLTFGFIYENGYSQLEEGFQQQLAGARNQTLRVNAIFSVAKDNNAYGPEFFKQDIAIIEAFNKELAAIKEALKTVEKNSNTAQIMEDNNPEFGTTATVIEGFIEGFEAWATDNPDAINLGGGGDWYHVFLNDAKTAVADAMSLDQEMLIIIREIRGNY